MRQGKEEIKAEKKERQQRMKENPPTAWLGDQQHCQAGGLRAADPGTRFYLAQAEVKGALLGWPPQAHALPL